MGARVLVVDDSPTLRRVVTGILTRSGYDAVSASDGIAALELLASSEEKFELVLLDFVMPRMTGYEFCRRIRAEEEWKALPVVLMSAKAEKIRAQFVEQTGALDAISKPFDARALLAVVENTLQKLEQGRAPREDTSTGPGDDLGGRVLGAHAGIESEPDQAAFRFARDVAEVVAPLLEQLHPSDRASTDATTNALTRAIARSLSPAQMTTLLGHLEEWCESAGPEEVLRGRSDAVPLGEMLQVLQMQMQTGRLVVVRGDVEISVYFEKGLIDVAASRGVAPEFRIGRYLVEEGLLGRDTLERVAEEARASSRLLGDYVVDQGLVSEDDVKRALIRQSSELIYEILRWPKARFSFRRQLGESTAVGAKLGLPVASLVMEGFRRVDEWRLIEELIDFDSVLYRDAVAIEQLGSDRLSRTEKVVLESIDGARAVREVVAMSNASSFDACKILYQFLQSRLVRRRVA